MPNEENRIDLKFLIKVRCAGSIKDHTIISQVLSQSVHYSKKISDVKSAIVSLGYINLTEGQFGILIENVTRVEYIKFMSIFLSNMYQVFVETKAINIADIADIEIDPKDWNSLNYLLDATKDTSDENI